MQAEKPDKHPWGKVASWCIIAKSIRARVLLKLGWLLLRCTVVGRLHAANGTIFLLGRLLSCSYFRGTVPLEAVCCCIEMVLLMLQPSRNSQALSGTFSLNWVLLQAFVPLVLSMLTDSSSWFVRRKCSEINNVLGVAEKHVETCIHDVAHSMHGNRTGWSKGVVSAPVSADVNQSQEALHFQDDQDTVLCPAAVPQLHSAVSAGPEERDIATFSRQLFLALQQAPHVDAAAGLHRSGSQDASMPEGLPRAVSTAEQSALQAGTCDSSLDPPGGPWFQPAGSTVSDLLYKQASECSIAVMKVFCCKAKQPLAPAALCSGAAPAVANAMLSAVAGPSSCRYACVEGCMQLIMWERADDGPRAPLGQNGGPPDQHERAAVGDTNVSYAFDHDPSAVSAAVIAASAARAASAQASQPQHSEGADVSSQGGGLVASWEHSATMARRESREENEGSWLSGGPFHQQLAHMQASPRSSGASDVQQCNDEAEISKDALGPMASSPRGSIEADEDGPGPCACCLTGGCTCECCLTGVSSLDEAEGSCPCCSCGPGDCVASPSHRSALTGGSAARPENWQLQCALLLPVCFTRDQACQASLTVDDRPPAAGEPRVLLLDSSCQVVADQPATWQEEPSGLFSARFCVPPMSEGLKYVLLLADLPEELGPGMMQALQPVLCMPPGSTADIVRLFHNVMIPHHLAWVREQTRSELLRLREAEAIKVVVEAADDEDALPSGGSDIVSSENNLVPAALPQQPPAAKPAVRLPPLAMQLHGATVDAWRRSLQAFLGDVVFLLEGRHLLRAAVRQHGPPSFAAGAAGAGGPATAADEEDALNTAVNDDLCGMLTGVLRFLLEYELPDMFAFLVRQLILQQPDQAGQLLHAVASLRPAQAAAAQAAAAADEAGSEAGKSTIEDPPAVSSAQLGARWQQVQPLSAQVPQQLRAVCTAVAAQASAAVGLLHNTVQKGRAAVASWRRPPAPSCPSPPERCCLEAETLGCAPQQCTPAATQVAATSVSLWHAATTCFQDPALETLYDNALLRHAGNVDGIVWLLCAAALPRSCLLLVVGTADGSGTTQALLHIVATLLMMGLGRAVPCFAMPRCWGARQSLPGYQQRLQVVALVLAVQALLLLLGLWHLACCSATLLRPSWCTTVLVHLPTVVYSMVPRTWPLLMQVKTRHCILLLAPYQLVVMAFEHVQRAAEAGSVQLDPLWHRFLTGFLPPLIMNAVLEFVIRYWVLKQRQLLLAEQTAKKPCSSSE